MDARTPLHRPTAESLAEVHAEAVIRQAAARAQARLDARALPSTSRRGLVVSLVAGFGLLAVAVWPTAADLLGDEPATRGTIHQHFGTSQGGPWQDPMRDPFAALP